MTTTPLQPEMANPNSDGQRTSGHGLGRVCILGATGSLGSEFVDLLRHTKMAATPTTLVGASHADCDITDARAVDRFVAKHRPDWVILTAAWTNVDGAEAASDQAFAVNEQGSANVANTCRRLGARLVAFSTDFVFDGQDHDAPFSGRRRTKPYREQDDTHPLSVYGRSKLAGDQAILAASPNAIVLRVGNLYGLGGRNFPARLADLLTRRAKGLRLDNERVMTPTWSAQVARQAVFLMEQNAPGGLYHVTCQGQATWAEFAHRLCDLLDLPHDFSEIASADLNLPAPRPAYHVLDNARLANLGWDLMPAWRDALDTYVSLWRAGHEIDATTSSMNNEENGPTINDTNTARPKNHDQSNHRRNS